MGVAQTAGKAWVTLRDALPESVGSRLRSPAYRYSVRDVPPPPAVPDRAVRVFIGPANYAAQGFNIARSLERDERVGAISMQFVRAKSFGFPSDNSVPSAIARHSPGWQRRQFDRVANGFSHVLVEAGIPIFGGLFSGGVAEEVEQLRAAGVKVGMISYGSELRLPSRHRASTSYSPFHDHTWPDVERLESGALKYARLLETVNAPVFVATPDMLLDWPDARWLPIIIDLDKWTEQEPPFERERPRVVHAPTNARIKGSDLAEPVLRRLHEAGLIEYQRIEGIPSAEMPAFYGSADIVIDQFLIGNYATAAIESLATGRLVIAHVDDQVRGHVRKVYNREVPIVDATVDSLEEVLMRILADRASYRAIAAQGPEFARSLHDGSATADVLGEFLGL